MEYRIIMDCKHWRDCGVSGGGCCNIEAYHRPSFGVCRICEQHSGGSKGLGDTIKRAIDKVTLGKVKPCGGCKKRQEALNKLLPYKQKGGK
jgi:5-methylcytosine-specific restriction endonuclease McrA